MSAGREPPLRLDGRQRGHQQYGYERNQRRRDRHGAKAANGIKSGAKRRPERKGGEHRHSDPGYDSSCGLWTHESQSPADRTRDDEALGPAKQRTAEQQYGHG